LVEQNYAVSFKLVFNVQKTMQL